MDRLTELDQTYDECTKWLHDHPDADHASWKEISEKRLAALKEKTELFKTQLNNIENDNIKIN